MRNDDKVRLQHMIDAAESALKFMSGRHRPDLDSNEMLLFAVVRAIEVVGEAAGKISEATRNRAPAIPWSAIVSMRNRLVHGYFDIDADIVWTTVDSELPALLRLLRELYAKL